MTATVVMVCGAALVVGFAAGLAIAYRQREHRQRVVQLFDRLAQLEVLVSQSGVIQEPAATPRGPRTVGDAGNPENLLARGKFSTLISSLLRRSQSPVPEPERLDVRAVGYLREHLDRRLTPSQLASGLNVSLRTLQRQVSASLGCSPRDLIVAVKMHEAKRMLSGGDPLVAAVARAVGFEDASYFSKKFKAYYGFLPSRLPETR